MRKGSAVMHYIFYPGKYILIHCHKMVSFFHPAYSRHNNF